MRFALIAVCVGVAGPLVGCTSLPTGPAVSPTWTAPLQTVPVTPTPSASPSLLPTPLPSATPTQVVDPQGARDTIAAGQIAVENRLIDPLCLRWDDADGDGQPEWVGLYQRPGDRPRLEGFILDGETWHELRAPEQEEYGLGLYPVCDLDVRDINADGKVEILIRGHAERTIDLLHIFVWDGTVYRLLASFEGDAGIGMEDLDGELGTEIIVRHDPRNGFAWEAVHTWDGDTYGWTWERYDWLHRDRPYVYLSGSPEQAVISFYLALDDRDLPGAYGLLSSRARSSQPYEGWAAGFDTTCDVQVGSVRQTDRIEGSATVTAQVRSYDNIDGYIVGRLWDAAWTVVAEDQLWRLESAVIQELDRWEVPFYP